MLTTIPTIACLVLQTPTLTHNRTYALPALSICTLYSVTRSVVSAIGAMNSTLRGTGAVGSILSEPPVPHFRQLSPPFLRLPVLRPVRLHCHLARHRYHQVRIYHFNAVELLLESSQVGMACLSSQRAVLFLMMCNAEYYGHLQVVLSVSVSSSHH
jgi:hypothetical protein